MRTPGHEIGARYEEYLIELLHKFKKCLPDYFIGPFTRVEKNSFLDAMGVDIVIGTLYGEIPIQVKARKISRSALGIRRNATYYRSLGIGFIVLVRNHSVKKPVVLIQAVITEVNRIILLHGDKVDGRLSKEDHEMISKSQRLGRIQPM